MGPFPASCTHPRPGRQVSRCWALSGVTPGSLPEPGFMAPRALSPAVWSHRTGPPRRRSAPPGVLPLPLPTLPHAATKAALGHVPPGPHTSLPFFTPSAPHTPQCHLHLHYITIWSSSDPPPPILNMGRFWFRRGKRELTKDA